MRLPPLLALLVLALTGLVGEARAQVPLGAPSPPASAPAAPDIRVRPDVEDADEAIEERLTGIFANVEELRGVRPTVRSGVVRLEGEASGPEAKKQAADLARRTDGVVFVDNDIEESTDVGEQISPTLGRLRKRADEIVQRGPLYGIALGTIALFVVLSGVIRRWDAPFRLLVKRRIVRDIVQQITAFAVLILGVVLALELLEATALVGAVLGAAGLVGIALGFAFRDIAENYLASILLGMRRPFSANDHVVIEGHEGKVVRLTTRETVLMTLDGNHVRLPNALVFKAIIVNYSSNPLRRFNFPVGIGVTTDLVEAQTVGVAALRDTPGVAAEPAPFTRVEELGDSNVVVDLFGWVDQREADWFKVRSEAVRRAKSAFDAAGIDMPVPMQKIQFEPTTTAQDDTERDARREGARVELSRSAHEVAPDDVLERQIATTKPPGDGDTLLTGE